MGIVYRGQDETLDRPVALKVLVPDALVDEAARARFRHEALALSRLNHPNICTIYEVGEADGQTFLAMEYIEGQPLSAITSSHALPRTLWSSTVTSSQTRSATRMRAVSSIVT